MRAVEGEERSFVLPFLASSSRLSLIPPISRPSFPLLLSLLLQSPPQSPSPSSRVLVVSAGFFRPFSFDPFQLFITLPASRPDACRQRVLCPSAKSRRRGTCLRPLDVRSGGFLTNDVDERTSTRRHPHSSSSNRVHTKTDRRQLVDLLNSNEFETLTASASEEEENAPCKTNAVQIQPKVLPAETRRMSTVTFRRRRRRKEGEGREKGKTHLVPLFL